MRKQIRTRREVISANLCAWAIRQEKPLHLSYDQVCDLVEAIFYGNTMPLTRGNQKSR